MSSSYIFECIQKDLKEDILSGFYLKTHGREGFIYFVEDDFITPIAIEMPAVNNLDIIVFGEIEHITERFNRKTFTSKTLDINERLSIQKLLLQWLGQQKLRHDIKPD